MTPPRETGFGPLSALWWPVVLLVLWPLAAVPVVGPTVAALLFCVLVPER